MWLCNSMCLYSYFSRRFVGLCVYLCVCVCVCVFVVCSAVNLGHTCLKSVNFSSSCVAHSSC